MACLNIIGDTLKGHGSIVLFLNLMFSSGEMARSAHCLWTFGGLVGPVYPGNIDGTRPDLPDDIGGIAAHVHTG